MDERKKLKQTPMKSLHKINMNLLEEFFNKLNNNEVITVFQNGNLSMFLM